MPPAWWNRQHEVTLAQQYGPGIGPPQTTISPPIKRPRPIPQCHPDRFHYARGMCMACYRAQAPHYRAAARL
jgi:hypothetical protein